MKEKDRQPSTRFLSPTLRFKNCKSSFLFLGSGSIHSVQLSTASSRRKSVIHTSLPKDRLHSPPHPGSTFCIFLSWPHHDQNFSTMEFLFCRMKGRERETPGQSQLSLLKHKGFPELFSLIFNRFVESRSNRKQEQTHSSNKCLLTSASTALSGSSRR